MAGELVFSATDTGSRRSVIVARETDAVWCYLTGPGSMSPVADCWLFNLVDAPETLLDYQNIDGVPPATARLTSQPSALVLPTTDEFSAVWSADGEAAAVAVRDRVLAFMLAREEHGYCRYLAVASPYGKPFDASLFAATFAATAD
jgi:hypothetical protein